ncbi:hypothetical protein BH11PSE4_BH11PSE4_14070 [soil metagenome]
MLLPAAALAALAIALFNYFWTGNGIHGSAGALLVVISSGLIAAAAIALVSTSVSALLSATLMTLLALGIIGTAVAAYMLEANVLVGTMALGAIGWIAMLMQPASSRIQPMGSL